MTVGGEIEQFKAALAGLWQDGRVDLERRHSKPLDRLKGEDMRRIQGFCFALFCSVAIGSAARAADLIVSAQDGKFVRVDGRATYPEPAPPDSLVVLDVSQFPPIVKATVEGLEHTVQGPPQAVAITPDGKLAIVAAPTRYDYEGKKELFDNFLQVVDLEATPPRLTAKVDVGAHIRTACPSIAPARCCWRQHMMEPSRCLRSKARTCGAQPGQDRRKATFGDIVHARWQVGDRRPAR